MSEFAIRSYDRQYLDGMCQTYNAMTESEPHIAPLDADLFARLVEDKSYFDPSGLFVAVERGRVTGWVHACVAPTTEGWQKGDETYARIRMLVFAPDSARTGVALVNEATEWLKRSGKQEILGFHCKAGYPFYRGLWMGGEPMVPATLAHIHMAFGICGYKSTHESIFLTARVPSRPSEVSAAVKLQFRESDAMMASDGMRESWKGFAPKTMMAYVDDECAGHIGWVLLPHVKRLGAPAMNIWSLSVDEQHRRKGIAAALVSRSMRLSWEAGARHASVGTQLWNMPAIASYAKFGFLPDRVLIARTLDLANDR